MRLRPVFATVLLCGYAGLASGQDLQAKRSEELSREIARLEGELDRLRTQEGGVLGELERLSAELNLGQTRLRELTLRGDTISERIAAHENLLGDLDRTQRERRRYLAFRLREMYMGGSRQALHRLLGDRDRDDYRGGLRYASFLSTRDASMLASYRDDQERAGVERGALLGEQQRLGETQSQLRAANRSLDAGRRRQQRLLDGIRDDAVRRESALVELRSAAGGMTDLIGELDPVANPEALDMAKFRGLLDWPAEGELRSSFGSVVHPRFKTRVPHPGIDIRAASGDPIRSVFDGDVVFSGWMRGYGLTTIVDHGNGLHSVYAHAAVTWLEPGERVRRGQRLGIVGETGSFSGPSLYFELRLNGRAVDPEDWLRPR